MAIPTPGAGPDRFELFWFTGKAWNRIVNLYDLLVFSSLLLSLECVAMAYVSCFIQQVPWNTMTCIIPFLVAFSIYNLNRKTDEDEDAVNRADRYAFTKRYEIPLFYGSVLACLLALALSLIYGGVPSLLATAAPFVFGTLYSFRCLPESFGYRRLKEIPAVKNCIVGLAWATVLAFLPVYLNQGLPDSRTGVTFVLYFLWGFMASMIPDIRDRTGDAAAGVKTIPVICGEKNAVRILTAVVLVIGLPLFIYSYFFLPAVTTGIILAAYLYSLLCVQLADRASLRDFVADALSDGQYIGFAAVIILGSAWYTAI